MDQLAPTARGIDAVLSVGNVTLNIDKKRVFAALRNFDLSPGEFPVLHLLMQRRGNVVPYEEVSNALLAIDNLARTHVLDTAVKGLRKKLVAAKADVAIRTVRNMGFILVLSKP